MRIISLLCSIILVLSGCTTSIQENSLFTKNESGNLVDASGVEYSFLATEGDLYYLGALKFAGNVLGEETSSEHLGYTYKTGMFSIENSSNDHILIRYSPNNEWFSIYRKSDLPPFDYSADNCIRWEFTSDIFANTRESSVHSSCNGGIVDKSEIEEFFAIIKSQKSPKEAGLYDLVRQPNGFFKNCYRYGNLCGFFENEPDLVIFFPITSYNDLAYSITIDDTDFVLPVTLLEKLIDSGCNTQSKNQTDK